MSGPQDIPWHRNPAIRGYIAQAALVALVVWGIFTIYTNTVANLEARGIQTGFGFLGEVAPFGVAFSPFIEYHAWGKHLSDDLFHRHSKYHYRQHIWRHRRHHPWFPNWRHAPVDQLVCVENRQYLHRNLPQYPYICCKSCSGILPFSCPCCQVRAKPWRGRFFPQ